MKRMIGIFAAVVFVVIMAACGNNKLFGEEDMIFVHEGIEYSIGSDASALIELFGDNYEEIASPSCMFVGEDKLFSYSFASVYTYPMEDVDLIAEIYIYGGEYKTNRDIGLGSSRDDVISAYGEDYFDDGLSLVYTVSGDFNDKESPKLYFEIMDDAVTGISYFGAVSIDQ